MALNEDKLNEFLGRFVTDLGATVAAGNVVIGHQLGLYKALAAAPATAEGLAERTHTNPRYVTEWLRRAALLVFTSPRHPERAERRAQIKLFGAARTAIRNDRD
jgi:uncharacterized SAM-binding protein YcdF (DUF218 family)